MDWSKLKLNQPKVEDKAAAAPGLGNKSAQVKWILGGIGVLIVGMLLSSHKQADSPATKQAGQAGFTPSAAKPTSPEDVQAAERQADFQMAQIEAQKRQQAQALQSQQIQASMVAPPGAYPPPATMTTPLATTAPGGAPTALEMRDYLPPVSQDEKPEAKVVATSAAADPPGDPVGDPPGDPRPAVAARPVATTPASPIKPKEPGPTLIEPSSEPDAPFFVIPEGTEIPCTLMVRIVGEFPGPADCEVSEDVWSWDRQHVLIPSGTKVLGTATAVTGYNQKRLAVAYHRMLMPDLYPVSLDKFTGLNADGSAALAGKVNNHYMSIFGAAAIVGLVGGVAQAGSGDIISSGSARLQSGIGNQMGMTSEQIMNRFLSQMPTITIMEGSRIKLYVTNDLSLPDYRSHTMSPHL
jgi:type IV secretion system protein VirB10